MFMPGRKFFGWEKNVSIVFSVELPDSPVSWLLCERQIKPFNSVSAKNGASPEL